MASIYCPRCDKDDTIRKLSSILASVTFSKPAPISGITIKDLNGLIRAPTLPEEPVASRQNPILSLSLYLLAYFAFLAPSWFLEFFLIVYIIEKIGQEFSDQYVEYVMPFMIGWAWVSLFLTFRFINKRLRIAAVNRYEKAKLQYSLEKSNWDIAMEKWNRSYFCDRDHIVFDPENGTTCDPTDLQKFLYNSTSG
jgi:hypothetical protein